MSEREVYPFKAEVARVLHLVIHSLYSNKEVFLRELISNASDSLDRLRFRSIQEPDLLGEGEELRIRVIPDREAGTLTIADNGVGMTSEQLAQDLGTVAWSGSRDFLSKLAAAKDANDKGLSLIGQFGVGFYSAYLVANDVEVVSRAAGDVQAHRWRSDGQESFSIEPATREERGTSVILHLKEDQKELLDTWRVRQLIQRYSDYIGHPIELLVEKPKAEGETVPKREFEPVNRASALWQRPPSEVTKEQYEELYKHLSHDWEPPLAWQHFHIEGTQMFTGLLFVPSRRPFDLFDPNPSHGVRLHVQRVFVLDEAEELVPRWLRFVRGIVDSEDLPLNVSREVLQDSRAAKIIRKQITSQILDLLADLAQKRPEDYQKFWENFGAVLKEGLHFDPDLKDRLAGLLRYASSTGEDQVSLDQYVDRMKEGQPAIYYASGTARSLLENSPHLEALKKRAYEVLFMTDTVDPFAVQVLSKYRDKPLVSAMTADLDLDGKKEDQKDGQSEEAKAQEAIHKALLDRFRSVLSATTSEVRVSERLTDSPACLVIPEGGLQPHIERMLRATRQWDAPESKRILEINPQHPLIEALGKVHERDPGSSEVTEWIELLHDQALLAEGSPVADPARVARQLSKLLTTTVVGAASQGG